MDRFWESHDFIIKAMTTHDETFNWEGEYFQYRQVNVWPRVWQEPHPPIWSTTGSPTQARVLGERGYVMATLGTGYGTRKLYDAYRKSYVAKFGKAPGADRFAYLGLVAVAHDEAEARRARRADRRLCALKPIVHLPFRNPPGYLPAEDNARLLRGETPPRSYTKDRRVVIDADRQRR
jgi:alkanesulfonate monooxygenase SsuD/methylene tetrahydromethanopterin reductase-like flavin-dependent oxidoreductase (luciferase family)